MSCSLVYVVVIEGGAGGVQKRPPVHKPLELDVSVHERLLRKVGEVCGFAGEVRFERQEAVNLKNAGYTNSSWDGYQTIHFKGLSAPVGRVDDSILSQILFPWRKLPPGALDNPVVSKTRSGDNYFVPGKSSVTGEPILCQDGRPVRAKYILSHCPKEYMEDDAYALTQKFNAKDSAGRPGAAELTIILPKSLAMEVNSVLRKKGITFQQLFETGLSPEGNEVLRSVRARKPQ